MCLWYKTSEIKFATIWRKEVGRLLRKFFRIQIMFVWSCELKAIVKLSNILNISPLIIQLLTVTWFQISISCFNYSWTAKISLKLLLLLLALLNVNWKFISKGSQREIMLWLFRSVAFPNYLISVIKPTDQVYN